MPRRAEARKLWASVLVMQVCIVWTTSEVDADADTPRFTLIVGYDYAEGDYGGDADTTIKTVPLTVKAENRNWVGHVQFSTVSVEQKTGDGEYVKDSGGGDTFVYAARRSQFSWYGENYLDWGIKVKIPTASEEKQLGTGETDWMLQLDGFRSHGRWLPFATLGYRWRGDDAEFDRDNGLYGSLGLHYQHDQNTGGGAILDYRSASTVRIEDGRELIPYIGYKFNTHLSTTLYGVLGLSDGSQDTGIGVQFILR